jgi:hypothetical protein
LAVRAKRALRLIDRKPEWQSVNDHIQKRAYTSAEDGDRNEPPGRRKIGNPDLGHGRDSIKKAIFACWEDR